MQSAIDVRNRVASIVESFPEGVAELVMGLHLKLQVRKKTFGWFMEDHHGDKRLALNCKAVPGLALSLVEQNPTIYHIPKYVGNKGWVGIWLDVPGLDWDEIAILLFEAYSLAAPSSLKRVKRSGESATSHRS